MRQALGQEEEKMDFLKQQINNYMRECRLCPRNCGVNRLAGEKGVCRSGAEAVVARSALHFWEEPCISGIEGSGAVFFSGCSLGCIFCQNRKISREEYGTKVSVEALADLFLRLQEQKANNINLVTAGQFLPQAAAAISLARSCLLYTSAWRSVGTDRSGLSNYSGTEAFSSPCCIFAESL